MENKSLRITVKSDSGSTYTITRKQGGGKYGRTFTCPILCLVRYFSTRVYLKESLK